MLTKHLDSSFWVKYAQTKEPLLISETLCNSPIGSKIFSEEKILNLIKNEDFVNYVFATFPLDVKLKTINALLKNPSDKIDLNTLSNTIRQTYTKSHFEHFKVNTSISATNPTKQQRDSYKILILNNSPSYLQQYFNDPTPQNPKKTSKYAGFLWTII